MIRLITLVQGPLTHALCLETSRVGQMGDVPILQMTVENEILFSLPLGVESKGPWVTEEGGPWGVGRRVKGRRTTHGYSWGIQNSQGHIPGR